MGQPQPKTQSMGMRRALEEFMLIIEEAPRAKLDGVSFIQEDYFARAANMAFDALQTWH